MLMWGLCAMLIGTALLSKLHEFEVWGNGFSKRMQPANDGELPTTITNNQRNSQQIIIINNNNINSRPTHRPTEIPFAVKHGPQGANLGPQVCVVLPVHDDSPHLEAAIRSLSSQTYQNLDIVIVDNALQPES